MHLPTRKNYHRKGLSKVQANRHRYDDGTVVEEKSNTTKGFLNLGRTKNSWFWVLMLFATYVLGGQSALRSNRREEVDVGKLGKEVEEGGDAWIGEEDGLSGAWGVMEMIEDFLFGKEVLEDVAEGATLEVGDALDGSKESGNKFGEEAEEEMDDVWVREEVEDITGEDGATELPSKLRNQIHRSNANRKEMLEGDLDTRASQGGNGTPDKIPESGAEMASIGESEEWRDEVSDSKAPHYGNAPSDGSNRVEEDAIDYDVVHTLKNNGDPVGYADELVVGSGVSRERSVRKVEDEMAISVNEIEEMKENVLEVLKVLTKVHDQAVRGVDIKDSHAEFDVDVLKDKRNSEKARVRPDFSESQGQYEEKTMTAFSWNATKHQVKGRRLTDGPAPVTVLMRKKGEPGTCYTHSDFGGGQGHYVKLKIDGSYIGTPSCSDTRLYVYSEFSLRTTWIRNTDGTFENASCPGMVMDNNFFSPNIRLIPKSNSIDESQLWNFVSGHMYPRNKGSDWVVTRVEASLYVGHVDFPYPNLVEVILVPRSPNLKLEESTCATSPNTNLWFEQKFLVHPNIDFSRVRISDMDDLYCVRSNGFICTCGEDCGVDVDLDTSHVIEKFSLIPIPDVDDETIQSSTLVVLQNVASEDGIECLDMNDMMDIFFGTDGLLFEPTGSLAFEICDSANDQQTFRLVLLGANKFLLRPVIFENGLIDYSLAVCLKEASGGLITIEQCGHENDIDNNNIIWEIFNGHIKSKAGDKCLVHGTVDGTAEMGVCPSTLNSYVSIIPFTGESRETYVYPSDDAALDTIFPQSGIHLFGNHDESMFRLQQSIFLGSETTLDFKFRLESGSNLKHRVCLNIDGIKCYVLIGDSSQNEINAPGFTAGEVNIYSLRIADDFSDLLDEDATQEITEIRFEQPGDDDTNTVRSIFWSIEIYNSVGTQNIGRSNSNITVALIFPENTTDTDTLWFLPSVTMQNDDGKFAVDVPAASVGRRLLEDHFTVENLPPGRRFRIALDPIDASGQALVGVPLATARAVFTDYTTCSCDNDEETGSPRKLEAFQSDGLIRLEFRDNSVCEEAYALTRQLVAVDGEPTDLVSFAPPFFYFATDECTSELLEPGNDYMDRVYDLHVGDKYNYCVSAVAKQYMIDPDVEGGSFLRGSQPKCVEHDVNWESSAVVKVTLKKESGGAPVEDVTVFWELLDTDEVTIIDKGNLTTLANGKVHIPLSSQDAGGYSDDTQLPLRIRVQKFSDLPSTTPTTRRSRQLSKTAGSVGSIISTLTHSHPQRSPTTSSTLSASTALETSSSHRILSNNPIGWFAIENSLSEMVVAVEAGECTNGMDIEAQERNPSSLNQQFYFEEGTLVSVVCPELVIEISGGVCEDARNIQLGDMSILEDMDDKRHKWEIKSDGSIRSAKCPDFVISITPANSPFSIVDPTEMAITVGGAPCNSSETLTGVQNYDQIILNQQFYVDENNRLESAICRGYYLTIMLQTDNTVMCETDEGIVLSLHVPIAHNDTFSLRQQWNFTDDGSIESASCENYVIGFNHDNAISLVLKGDSGWNQEWEQRYMLVEGANIELFENQGGLYQVWRQATASSSQPSEKPSLSIDPSTLPSLEPSAYGDGDRLALINIGNSSGSATEYNLGFWRVYPSQGDVTGITDNFSFLHAGLQSRNFDVTISFDSDVSGWENPKHLSKGGLMIRNTLEDDSKMFFTFIGGTCGQLLSSARYITGDVAVVVPESTETDGDCPSIWPESFEEGWLRLERSGNTVTSYAKSDFFSDWTELGHVTVDYTNFYVGIAVSHGHEIGVDAPVFRVNYFDEIGNIVYPTTKPSEVPSSQPSELPSDIPSMAPSSQPGTVETFNILNHTFLCDNEEFECPEEGFITYMSHLDFKKEIQFADATTIRMRGTVYIGEKDSGGFVATGCVLPGVEVCLNQKMGLIRQGEENDLVVECTETDKDGQYSLYALVGSMVYPTVNLTGHTFEPLGQDGREDSDKTFEYRKGIKASVEALRNGLFDDHDFFDTTLESLNVTVAGGVCDIFLGVATIKVTLEGCDKALYEQHFTQASTSEKWLVPAHVINVKLDDIVAEVAGDRKYVMTRLQALGEDMRRIDLTSIGEVENEVNEVESEENVLDNGEEENLNEQANADLKKSVDAVSHCRFQYDGILNIRPEIEAEKDLSGNCSSYERETVYESTSFHVVRSQKDFGLSLYLRQLIIDEDSQYCDIVDISTEVTVNNRVGLVHSNPQDKKILNLLSDDEKSLALYTKCSAGCVLPVDGLEEEESQSKIVLQLKAGIPRTFAGSDPEYPFTKTITISSGSSTHLMRVVIVGDHSDGLGNSFSVPTLEPLLIIRDPPGGKSSVSYSNVETTTRITMDNFEAYAGFDVAAELHWNVQTKSSSCAGLGVAACLKITDNEASFGGGLNGGASWLVAHKSSQHSHTLTITWTYSTSGSAAYAGRESDVFLIPTIAVIFRTTDTIEFDPTASCKATKTTKVKFDLSSLDNRSPISFLTYKQVKSEIMPELESILDSLEEESIDNTTTTRLAEISLQIPIVNASLISWTEILSDYEDVNQNATAGDLEKVGNWFKNRVDDKASNKVYEFEHPQAKHETVSLVSNELADGEQLDEEFSSTKLAAQLAEKVSSTTVQSTNTIQFSGGGGLLTLKFMDAELDQLEQKWNRPINSFGNAFSKLKDNVDAHAQVGTAGHFDLAVGVGLLGGIGGSASSNVLTSTSHRMYSADGTSDSTSISITFGDDNVGDEFLVDIYLDPKYNTFVFHIVEGQSRCPHEIGTRAMEIPSIAVVDVSRSPIVAQDEPMVFDIELVNLGYGSGSFKLYTDKIDNTDGLAISINGANVNSLSPWYLVGTKKGGRATLATLTIERGPRMDSYKPLQVFLQSTCDTKAKNSDTLWNVAHSDKEGGLVKFIEFTEPCLEFNWAGNLKQYSKFLINSNSPNLLDITIFNPGKQKMAAMPRLEQIELEYRQVSDRFPDWTTGFAANSEKLNFLNAEEDSFGYATASWRVPSISAAYEVRLKSVCTYEETAPDRLNFHITDSVFGLIDREPPAVSGLPMPSKNLYPGEALAVEFTEDLDCEVPYRFDVSLLVSDFVKVFDLDDLDIVCSDNVIRVQFEEGRIPTGSYEDLLGRDYTLTIMEVWDKSGNVMESYTYMSNFVCLPPKPHLVITHPAGPTKQYLPHEPVVFEVALSNDREEEEWATSTLNLGVDLVTNAADFTILVNGDSLTDIQKYTLQGNETVTTTVTILKGPGKQLRFSPISLFLRSDCVEDSDDPIRVTADVWNQQDQNGNKFIKFTPPCPSIRWAGEMHKSSKLVINSNTMSIQDSLLEISIHNIEYTDRKLFDRSINNALAAEDTRLNDVVLLYRHVGDWDISNWEQGQLIDTSGNSVINGRPVEFSMESIEDSFGFSTLNWNLSSVADSTYQVKVVSQCSPLLAVSTDELDSYSTAIIDVVIDTTAPTVYGAPSLQVLNNFHPRDEFIIPFTEELYCEKPFVFALNLTLVSQTNDTTVLKNEYGLDVKCEGKAIKFSFDMEMFSEDNIHSLYNYHAKVELEGVADLARNEMESMYEVSYNQCDQTLSQTIVRGMGCDRADQNCDGIVDDCEEDLVPPTISMSDGVILTELPEHPGKDLVMSHCFDSSSAVELFLARNVYAEDDCAQNLLIDIAEVASLHTLQKNHKYNLTEFMVIATDSRCGAGESSSANKTFLTEVFDEYDQDVKHQGCNGIDENCDGIIDDCTEDRSPPTISLNDISTLSYYHRHDGVTVIDSPAFSSITDAQEYLLGVLKVEDDCANNLSVEVSPALQAGCVNTVFTVNVTDPRCAGVNPLQTVTKEFALWVDDTPPSVSVGFSLDRHPTYYDADGLYLHIDEDDIDYINVRFWYNVTDNCPSENKVEVVVSSNEISSSKTSDGMVLLRKKRSTHKSQSMQIFVEPRMCNRQAATEPMCDWDDDTAPFRFYEIDVIVTDNAHNVGNAKATVIILPKTLTEPSTMESNESRALMSTNSFFIDMLDGTTPQNVIQLEDTLWVVEEQFKNPSGSPTSSFSPTQSSSSSPSLSPSMSRTPTKKTTSSPSKIPTASPISDNEEERQDTFRYFPNWYGRETKCLNDANQLPNYMKQSDYYRIPTAEQCCVRFYQWAIPDCIELSGGDASSVATNEWYVDWYHEACRQSCLEGAGLNCGGIARGTVTMFASPKECCEKTLPYVALHTCVAESLPPPSKADGSKRWYVSYFNEKCIRDCQEGESESCGGVVRESHVTLFDSPVLCCAEKLGWLPSDDCRSKSLSST